MADDDAPPDAILHIGGPGWSGHPLDLPDEPPDFIMPALPYVPKWNYFATGLRLGSGSA